MDLLMPAYGNGNLCSRKLYYAINRAYLATTAAYYSFHKHHGTTAKIYLQKDGEYIKAFPPLGDSLCDTYDKACSTRALDIVPVLIV
jgi:hypothetical protein